VIRPLPSCLPGWLIHAFVPLLPVHTPWKFVLLAEFLSITIGIIARIMPACQAALLDPREALRSE
jgi:putative ABC transport system permease protein